MTIERLSREKLENLLAKNIYPNLDLNSYNGIFELINKDDRIMSNKPTEVLHDPIFLHYIIDCSKRDYRPKSEKGSCPICKGETTAIILENGTDPTPFINLNLFPYRHPIGIPVNSIKNGHATPLDFVIGGSFLQWHTTEHKEIHQLTYEEYFQNLLQLQVFEKLLGNEINFRGKIYPAYFEVFKNVGERAGRSIEHGHHQVQFSNLGSPLIKRQAESNGQYTPSSIKEKIKIKDYDTVSIFAPRSATFPLEVIITSDNGIECLMDADEKALRDLSTATVNTARALYHLMPKRNGFLAYNMVFRARKDAGGMYIHIIPKSATVAGSELSGLHVRQMTPEQTANIYPPVLNEVEKHNPEDYELEPKNE